METNTDPAKQDEQINNPAEAGRKAIEAEKLTNEKDKPQDQQQKDDAEDAEKWRNEG